jgi:hypothetical protein
MTQIWYNKTPCRWVCRTFAEKIAPVQNAMQIFVQKCSYLPVRQEIEKGCLASGKMRNSLPIFSVSVDNAGDSALDHKHNKNNIRGAV